MGGKGPSCRPLVSVLRAVHSNGPRSGRGWVSCSLAEAWLGSFLGWVLYLCPRGILHVRQVTLGFSLLGGPRSSERFAPAPLRFRVSRSDAACRFGRLVRSLVTGDDRTAAPGCAPPRGSGVRGVRMWPPPLPQHLLAYFSNYFAKRNLTYKIYFTLVKEKGLDPSVWGICAREKNKGSAEAECARSSSEPAAPSPTVGSLFVVTVWPSPVPQPSVLSFHSASPYK